MVTHTSIVDFLGMNVRMFYRTYRAAVNVLQKKFGN